VRIKEKEEEDNNKKRGWKEKLPPCPHCKKPMSIKMREKLFPLEWKQTAYSSKVDVRDSKTRDEVFQ